MGRAGDVALRRVAADHGHPRLHRDVCGPRALRRRVRGDRLPHRAGGELSALAARAARMGGDRVRAHVSAHRLSMESDRGRDRRLHIDRSIRPRRRALRPRRPDPDPVRFDRVDRHRTAAGNAPRRAAGGRDDLLLPLVGDRTRRIEAHCQAARRADLHRGFAAAEHLAGDAVGRVESLGHFSADAEHDRHGDPFGCVDRDLARVDRSALLFVDGVFQRDDRSRLATRARRHHPRLCRRRCEGPGPDLECGVSGEQRSNRRSLRQDPARSVRRIRSAAQNAFLRAQARARSRQFPVRHE